MTSVYLIIARETGYEPDTWAVAAHVNEAEARQHATLAEAESQAIAREISEAVQQWDGEGEVPGRRANPYDAEANNCARGEAGYAVVEVPLLTAAPVKSIMASIPPGDDINGSAE